MMPFIQGIHMKEEAIERMVLLQTCLNDIIISWPHFKRKLKQVKIQAFSTRINEYWKEWLL